MIITSRAKLEECTLHLVGNKLREEGVSFSKRLPSIDAENEQNLMHYFFSSFRYEELYTLYHETELMYNEVYGYVSAIFNDPTTFPEESAHLARHLYQKSVHPKVRKGEFYVAYFGDCEVDGEKVNAVGLFKSENKDTFLKIHANADSFEIESQQGVNINKLEKGCLIFNTKRDEGYVVAIVDNINKSMEAKYWTEDFLHVRRQRNDFNSTTDMLSLFNGFVANELPADYNKVEQAFMLRKTLDTIKKRKQVNLPDVAEEVFNDPALLERFENYQKEFAQQHEMHIPEVFEVSEPALKKKGKGTMQVIRLDRNFDLRIHGGEQQIERGYDEERGMHYYKLYFKEEK
ncbi:MAG: nucleoid-associated protein [Bacteroidales bacterium]